MWYVFEFCVGSSSVMYASETWAALLSPFTSVGSTVTGYTLFASLSQDAEAVTVRT